MPSPLIDRDEEQAALRRLADSGRPHLALVTGRRRVGKTFLLTHTWEERAAFYFTASKTTPEVNRRQLIEDLAAWSGEDLRPEDYPTWRAVFNMLLDFRAPEPLVVVLDEFQYFGDGETGAAEVASELNAAWERRRPERPFLLVLSGSAVGTMEALASGGGPLYGRFSWHGRLRPFGYWHTAEMVPFGDGAAAESLRERARAYGVFGGTPRYLAAVDPSRTVAENAAALLLDPKGEVRLLIETALEQEDGLRDVSKYRALLRAVASGRTTRNEIAQAAGLGNDRALRDKLERLVELGYAERRKNIDARPSATVRYAVADPAFRFYERFVEPNRSVLERVPAARVWSEAVAPRFDRYMGHEFERVAVEAYDRIADQRGLPLVAEWGRWEGVDEDRKPVEIDAIGRLLGGGVLTAEVKWNREAVGPAVHTAHVDKLQRMAASGRAWAHEALSPGAPLLYVAAGGFTPEFRAVAEADGHDVTCWSLSDLYAPESLAG